MAIAGIARELVLRIMHIESRAQGLKRRDTTE